MSSFEKFVQTYRFSDGWSPIAEMIGPALGPNLERPLPKILFETHLRRKGAGQDADVLGSTDRVPGNDDVYMIRLYQTPRTAKLTPQRLSTILHELGHVIHSQSSPWCQEYRRGEAVINDFGFSSPLERELWIFLDRALASDWATFDVIAEHLDEAYAELYAFSAGDVLHRGHLCKATWQTVHIGGLSVTMHGLVALGAIVFGKGLRQPLPEEALAFLSACSFQSRYLEWALESEVLFPKIAQGFVSQWSIYVADGLGWGLDDKYRRSLLHSMRKILMSSDAQEGLTRLAFHVLRALKHQADMEDIPTRLKRSPVPPAIRRRDVPALQEPCLAARALLQSRPQELQRFNDLCRRFVRKGEKGFISQLRRAIGLVLPSCLDGFFFVILAFLVYFVGTKSVCRIDFSFIFR